MVAQPASGVSRCQGRAGFLVPQTYLPPVQGPSQVQAGHIPAVSCSRGTPGASQPQWGQGQAVGSTHRVRICALTPAPIWGTWARRQPPQPQRLLPGTALGSPSFKAAQVLFPHRQPVPPALCTEGSPLTDTKEAERPSPLHGAGPHVCHRHLCLPKAGTLPGGPSQGLPRPRALGPEAPLFKEGNDQLSCLSSPGPLPGTLWLGEQCGLPSYSLRPQCPPTLTPPL